MSTPQERQLMLWSTSGECLETQGCAHFPEFMQNFSERQILWIAIANSNSTFCGTWGVLVLLKFYWAPDIVEFVFGRFSHFYIAIAYSNSTFCGAWTPSFCEFTQNFSKSSTPLNSQVFVSSLENGPNFRKMSTPQRTDQVSIKDLSVKLITRVCSFCWNFDGFQVNSQKLGVRARQNVEIE